MCFERLLKIAPCKKSRTTEWFPRAPVLVDMTKITDTLHPALLRSEVTVRHKGQVLANAPELLR
jgi:hypothetical protein